MSFADVWGVIAGRGEGPDPSAFEQANQGDQDKAGARLLPALADRPMIRLDNISKQNGHQILFIEASMSSE